MADDVIKIIGAKEVEAKFRALATKIQNKITRKGMTAAGRIVRDKARELCPVVTGELRKSIKARKPKGTKRGEIRREVAATTPYAKVIELGHQSAGNDVPAHPFLKPALDQSTGAVVQALQDAVAEGIKGQGD